MNNSLTIPRYSIIIPCYNSSGTIIRALDSLFSQKTSGYEVIVVDDCSADDTVSKVEKYRDSNRYDIKIVKKTTNSGPGESRNLALDIAQGQYIAFMDSDDYVTGDYFEVIDRAISQNNADVVYFGCNLVIGDTIRPSFFTAMSGKEDFMALSTGALGRIVASSKCWDGLKLPSISNAEDIAVIPLLYMKATNIIQIKDCLYNYVYNPSSLSSKINPNVVTNFIKSFHFTLKNYQGHEYDTGIEYHGIKTILYGAILNGIKAGVSFASLKTIIDDFEYDFPHWKRNKYIYFYPRRKRLFLSLLNKRLFNLLKIYVRLHSLYLKYNA